MSASFILNAYPSHCQGGGGVIKIHKIRAFLRGCGHQVELFDPWTTRIEKADIYHHFSFFPGDLPMIRYAQATGVKIAIETMYWGSWRHTLTAASPSKGVYFRGVARYALRRFVPRATRERVNLDLADCVMVNSQFERDNIVRDFSISREKIAVCPNGADATFGQATPDLFVERYGLKDFVLVTGLFEQRKNQLGLIRAMRGLDIPLVLIGGAPAVHQWYLDQCREAAGPDVHFINFLDHDDPLFRSAYAACRVLALPSWHETTGKSVLEAGLLAKNVIMTTYAPAAKEYFEDYVFYVDPHDEVGLRKAVVDAMDAEPANLFRTHIQRNFTWDKVLAIREKHYLDLLQ